MLDTATLWMQEMRDTLKPCVSTRHCDLQKPSKSAAQAPRACHQAQSHHPARRSTSDQIFYFLCQAAAISHFSSERDGPNVGIHYHTTLFASSLRSLSCHGSTAYPSGGPPAPCLVCAAPKPWIALFFSPVHRCQKTFSQCQFTESMQ